MKRKTIRVTTSLGLLLVVILLTTAFACTSKQQTQAAKFADTYAQSLKSIHDAVDSSFLQGKLTPAERQGAYQALLRANEAGLHLNAAIRGVANATGSVAVVTAALDEAAKAIDDGTAAIKNPETKALILSLAASAKSILTQISSIYADGGTQ